MAKATQLVKLGCEPRPIGLRAQHVSASREAEPGLHGVKCTGLTIHFLLLGAPV